MTSPSPPTPPAVMVRDAWFRVWPSLLAVVTVSAVGGPAAVASYRHQRDVIAANGDPVMAPWLPLSVDGMLLAALVVLWVRRRRGDSPGWLPWLSFGAGMAATVAANLAAVTLHDPTPSPVAYVVALWPPVALALTLELVALVAARAPRGSIDGAAARAAMARLVDELGVAGPYRSVSSPARRSSPARAAAPSPDPSPPSTAAGEGALSSSPAPDDEAVSDEAADLRRRLTVWALTNRQPNGRPAGKKRIKTAHGCKEHDALKAWERAVELYEAEQSAPPLRVLAGGER